MYGYPQQQQYLPQLRGRMVSSFDEVKASPIDFDGTVSFFPDLNNNKIYTKQICKDGTCQICMYEKKEIPVEKPVEYVTKEEFEKAIAKLTNSNIANNF